MDAHPPVLIDAKTLETLVRDIFVAAGSSADEAAGIAQHLLGANLAGHDSHGVVRVPRYIDWHRAGHVHFGRTARVVTDGGAFALLDADFGFGQTVARQAAELGIARAKQHGAAVIALRNAGHVGRIGHYAEMALAEGLISIHLVNVAGSVLVAPFGGVERRFSTAPIAIGAPLEGRPVVLDFATSHVAEGKVLVASNGGKALPKDALIEPDGTLSGDPHTLYGDYPPIGPRNPAGGAGAIRAFGEHKGSGLALMCELLAGAFTAGGTSGPVEGRGRIANGMLSIYLSPAHFGTEAAFQEMGQAYVEWVASSRPARPGQPVLLPGEPEARTRAERLAHGVPLQPDTWTGLLQTAASLGVPAPA
ncbi:malate/lactate/ureidoglycolate dehydrogenase [Pseudoroseomonas rhizosphaerae]|uniref:Malate/lactate/ureidoglycolate dehydrogenase n=1 Tax=Teichococcus rhizosphaerae TaxID=1335062 RepID=A0A2C7AAF3_9PROT|nr:malate/lactate/ureidoglycolate dehydrogenase [Pseudoroseomonas rhizosphaerae]PHK94044.1 malate/lactate/ureidoglycolate dehydrogenase [Pseudoroseomonas rhizosphaerae]